MSNSAFDEVDLNYILSAVSYFKLKIKTMDPVWIGSSDNADDCVRLLSSIEEKIYAQLDGDRQ